MKFIKRKFMKENPETLFIFGDNFERRGHGGQAKEMRAEPNAVGIPTKRSPTYEKDAFLKNKDFDEFKTYLDKESVKLINAIDESKDIVIPYDGIGTGIAKLPKYAPKIAKYIDYFFDCLVARWLINENLVFITKTDLAIVQMMIQSGWTNKKIKEKINNIPNRNYDFSFEDVDKLKLLAFIMSDDTVLKKNKIKCGMWRYILKPYDT